MVPCWVNSATKSSGTGRYTAPWIRSCRRTLVIIQKVHGFTKKVASQYTKQLMAHFKLCPRGPRSRLYILRKRLQLKPRGRGNGAFWQEQRRLVTNSYKPLWDYTFNDDSSKFLNVLLFFRTALLWHVVWRCVLCLAAPTALHHIFVLQWSPHFIDSLLYLPNMTAIVSHFYLIVRFPVLA